MAHQRIPLSKNWTFQQASDPNSSPLPVTQFPTAIHLDLMHHKIIPDPFLDTNYTQVQWVGEEEWLYQTKFTAPLRSSSTHYELVFEGLDTHATISLNGKEIKKTDNMYLHYYVDVTKDIKPGAENELQILFHSTFLIGRQLEKEANFKALFLHNGDSSRLQVRKAPYAYGWDFTQPFLTSGPWRPIYLDVYEAKFKDLLVVGTVAADLASAKIDISASIQGTGIKTAKIQLLSPKNEILQETEVPVSGQDLKTELSLQNPDLWWPNGNGAQPLYHVTITGSNSTTTALCKTSKRIGFRRLQLIQHSFPDQEGKSFFFQINNVPIFARGADWTPADMFLPRITPAKYRDWVELAAQGNQNMIRVWGGGVYEDHIFYDLCDELGIMVWQDFMLACGAYPAHPEFLKVIEEEAIFNVRDLRHHPSIVLWCGNNEDHMFADLYRAQYDESDHNPENWLKTNWPARIIYDKVLPEVCKVHCPEIPYHPGSPWGGRLANSMTEGDVHAWDVWMKASMQYPYQWYYKLAGRFISEFGLKSYPPLKSIKTYITDPSEHRVQSRVLDAHLKASSKSPWAKDYRTVALYIQENLRINTLSLKSWVYGSQLSQAEAMGYAYRDWRRLWKGPGKEECAGALVWVLNDAFPSVSWSLADFWVRPKYAYWSIKRACDPLVVGATRREVVKSRKSEFTEAYVEKEERVQVWGSNFTFRDVKGAKLVVSRLEAASGKVLSEKTVTVDLPANRSTELVDEAIDEIDSQTTLVYVRLLDGKSMDVLARFIDWPQPLKYLDFAVESAGIKVQVSKNEGSADEDMITVSSTFPVKGLVFEVEDDDKSDEVQFDDNCIDLAGQGDEVVIKVKNLNGREVEIMHLGLATEQEA